jgi:hypothetical protein
MSDIMMTQGRDVRVVDGATFILGTKGVARKLRGSKYYMYQI